jgi:hypothetical protein
MSIYTDNGYSSREEYLNLLREDYGEKLVNSFLAVYPPSEDFTGLLFALENADCDEPEDEDEEEYDEEEEYEEEYWEDD